MWVPNSCWPIRLKSFPDGGRITIYSFEWLAAWLIPEKESPTGTALSFAYPESGSNVGWGPDFVVLLFRIIKSEHAKNIMTGVIHTPMTFESTKYTATHIWYIYPCTDMDWVSSWANLIGRGTAHIAWQNRFNIEIANFDIH